MFAGEDKTLFSRLEKFKEVTESPTSFDGEQAKILLRELKLIIMKEGYLSQNARQIPFLERMMFREILEIAIIMCVKMQNFQDIPNYFRQLSFYYFENDDLPQSQRMFTLIDVNLLMDLAFNKNDEYLVSLTQVLSTFPHLNFNIKFVLDVERCLNDNSIAKLFALQKNSPSILFDIFLQKILERIRRTIATNVLKQSIEKLTVLHLEKLLQFQKEDEITEFLEELGWEVTQEGEVIVPMHETPEDKTELHQMMLSNILNYAVKFSSLM